LREGAPTLRVARAPEGARVLRRVGDVFHRRVERQESPSKGKCSGRGQCRQRTTEAVEERHQRPCPELITPVSERTLARHLPVWIRPDEAQAAAQPFEDRADRKPTIEVQSD